MRVVGVAMLFLVLSAKVTFSQQGKATTVQLGVDILTIKDGPRLRGAILNRDASGQFTMAVSREWLNSAYPKFFEKHQSAESQQARAHVVALRDRIQAWKKERADDRELVQLLESRLEQVDEQLEDLGDKPKALETQFLLVQVPGDQVKRFYVQPAARKQIALLAWQVRLENPETRETKDLLRELRENKIELTQVVNLGDRLPPRGQSAREWAGRKAIVEYEFRKPLDFQGMGGMLLPAGAQAKDADLAQVLGQLLEGNLGNDLAKLLGDVKTGKPQVTDPFATAKKSADAKGAIGFRTTRVNQDLRTRRVAVESRFLARMPNGKWETIWTHTETADATKDRPDARQRIEDDPRIGKILKTFEALGLGVDKQMQIALNFGAATMEAQKNADSKFFEFRDRYLGALDGPMLVWPKKQ